MKKILHIFLGTFVLLSWGFKNRFPFVYPDTGDHIASGFETYIPYSRPYFYGLYLRHISLAETLWLPAFLQASFIVLGIYYICKYFANKSWTVFYLLIGLSVFCSSASITAAMLIPDVFTPIMLISCALILSGKLNTKDTLVNAALILIALPMHSSHLLILFGSVVLYLFGFIKLKKQESLSFKPLFQVGTAVILSLGLAYSINYTISGKIKLNNGSSVFLVNRLYDLNILKPFLSDQCKDGEYPICAYADEIYGDFLWGSHSPIYKHGGWTALEDEYADLCFDILTTPKYLKQFIIKSLEAGLVQFWMFEVDFIEPNAKGSSPHWAMISFYPHYLANYEMSQQSQNAFDFDQLNNRQRIMVLSCTILLIFFLIIGIGKRLSPEWKSFCYFLCAALFANAYVCGALSLPLARYQSRVSFLLLIMTVISIYQNKNQILAFVKEKITKQIPE